MSKWWANEANEEAAEMRVDTRDYEWVVYPSTRVDGPGQPVRGSSLTHGLDRAVAAAKQIGPGAGVYGITHGGFVGYVTQAGRWQPIAFQGQLSREAGEEAPRFGDLPPAPGPGDVDEHALNDLWLFADNTSSLYNQKKSIIENLTRRIKKGTYDPNLAPVLWEYWVESAAKLYATEFPSSTPWHKQFNKATRDELARRIAVHEYQDIMVHAGGIHAKGSEEETHAADFPNEDDARAAAVKQGATLVGWGSPDNSNFTHAVYYRPWGNYWHKAGVFFKNGKYHLSQWEPAGTKLPEDAGPVRKTKLREEANEAPVVTEAGESANVIFENDAAEEEQRKAKKLIKKLRWHREAPGIYFAQGNLGVYKTHRQRPNRRKDILPIVLTLDSSPLKSFEMKDEARSFAQHYDEITPFISKQNQFVQPVAPSPAPSTPEASPMGPLGAPVDTSTPGGCLPWVKISRDPERYSACLAIAQKLGPVNNARKVYDLLNDSMMREDQEVLVVILCDVQGQLRGVSEVHRGARSRVGVAVADVMRVVLASGAEMFLISHNHPSGKAHASDADIHLTKEVKKAAKLYGSELTFVDHVVLGNKQFFSIEEDKLYKVK